MWPASLGSSLVLFGLEDSPGLDESLATCRYDEVLTRREDHCHNPALVTLELELLLEGIGGALLLWGGGEGKRGGREGGGEMVVVPVIVGCLL